MEYLEITIETNTRVWTFHLLETACSERKVCGLRSECVGRGSMSAVHRIGGIFII